MPNNRHRAIERYTRSRYMRKLRAAALRLASAAARAADIKLNVHECKKRSFYSKESADLMLEKIRRASKKYPKWKRIKRSYKCTVCGFWHHTSQEGRGNESK